MAYILFLTLLDITDDDMETKLLMNDEDLRYDMKKNQTSNGKIIINHQFFFNSN